MIYTVTFNPALDYVMKLTTLQTGQVNRSLDEEIQFGGKGINVSTVLKNLGWQSVALGYVAGFTGQALVQGLQAIGITTDFITLPQGMTRINVKIKGSEETEINGRGPEIGAEALLALMEKLDILQPGDCLVLAGSIPSGVPSDIYEQILSRLTDRQILSVVDATGSLLSNVLPYHPFLIKPNNQELGELFQTVLETDAEIIRCARQLQADGARNVLVSMAANGSILLDESGTVHRLGVPKGTVKNSVGAGDSMVAGFLAGWLETGDYAYAHRMGAATGSATAFSLGLAQKEAVETLLKSSF